MKILKRAALVALSAQLLSACGGSRSNPLYPDMPVYDPTNGNIYTPKPDVHGYEPNQPQQPTFTTMRNVFLRVDPEIGILIKQLEGRLESKRAGDPVIFDDVRSFTTHVYRAEMEIDQDNITRLKNKYTFNFADTPIKDVQVEFTPGMIKMSGRMKQMVWVPFSMEGTLSPTPDGKLIMVPSSIKVSGIPMKSMMDLIGLTTSKLLSFPVERGLQFQGNNVILDPAKLFPPPEIAGKVVGVEVLQGKMRMIFDSNQRIMQRPVPDLGAPNFMHVYGNKVLIMNELHRGAELQMVDMNPATPFDFYMAGYRAHLKAGYVKVHNDAGTLIALMPDYTQLGKTEAWGDYPGGKPTQLRPYASTRQDQGYLSYSSFAARMAPPRR
ncbi:MAG: hypothetical protein CVV27_18895 [Candidatus Melainabacteria bacterium HGW-Melainabacteria-1]|nr:MAG: hypothetical protein CVV27_18895 [Candidatus Melainabacteria bacterium HGW-Melainabacteria-1]